MVLLPYVNSESIRGLEGLSSYFAAHISQHRVESEALEQTCGDRRGSVPNKNVI